MEFVIQQVTVTNWSKDPFFKMNDAEKAMLGKAITYSRQIVTDSVAVLLNYQRQKIVAGVDTDMAADYFSATDSAAVVEALPKYFGLSLTSPTIDADLQTVISKFQQIKAGLIGPFEIVVGAVHDFDDVKEGVGDAFQSFRAGDFRGAVKNLKTIRTGTGGWISNKGNGVRGRIHLNKDRLKTFSAGKIARIIVHEASHKYAGTVDVAYKWNNLKNNAGGHLGLINNADSYAWAGRLMWKRKRNLAAGV